MSSKRKGIAERRNTKQSEWNATSILLALAGCVVVGLLIFFGIRLFGQQARGNTATPSPSGGSLVW